MVFVVVERGLFAPKGGKIADKGGIFVFMHKKRAFNLVVSIIITNFASQFGFLRPYGRASECDFGPKTLSC